MHQDPNQPQTPADSSRQPSLTTNPGAAPSQASAVTESGLGPVPPSTPGLEVVLRRLSLVVQKVENERLSRTRGQAKPSDESPSESPIAGVQTTADSLHKLSEQTGADHSIEGESADRPEGAVHAELAPVSPVIGEDAEAVLAGKVSAPPSPVDFADELDALLDELALGSFATEVTEAAERVGTIDDADVSLENEVRVVPQEAVSADDADALLDEIVAGSAGSEVPAASQLGDAADELDALLSELALGSMESEIAEPPDVFLPIDGDDATVDVPSDCSPADGVAVVPQPADGSDEVDALLDQLATGSLESEAAEAPEPVVLVENTDAVLDALATDSPVDEAPVVPQPADVADELDALLNEMATGTLDSEHAEAPEPVDEAPAVQQPPDVADELDALLNEMAISTQNSENTETPEPIVLVDHTDAVLDSLATDSPADETPAVPEPADLADELDALLNEMAISTQNSELAEAPEPAVLVDQTDAVLASLATEAPAAPEPADLADELDALLNEMEISTQNSEVTEAPEPVLLAVNPEALPDEIAAVSLESAVAKISEPATVAAELDSELKELPAAEAEAGPATDKATEAPEPVGSAAELDALSYQTTVEPVWAGSFVDEGTAESESMLLSEYVDALLRENKAGVVEASFEVMPAHVTAESGSAADEVVAAPEPFALAACNPSDTEQTAPACAEPNSFSEFVFEADEAGFEVAIPPAEIDGQPPVTLYQSPDAPSETAAELETSFSLPSDSQVEETSADLSALLASESLASIAGFVLAGSAGKELIQDAPASAEPTDSAARIEDLVDAIDAEMGDSAAAPPKERATVTAARQHVVFLLSGTRYAVPIGEVLEMSTVPRITSLPNVPDFVRGVTNLRGEVLAVLELRALLHLTAGNEAARERMLIVKPAGTEMVAGLIVDSVRGLAYIAGEELQQPAGPLEDPVVAYLAGVTEYENQVLHALDLQKLFEATEIAALSAH